MATKPRDTVPPSPSTDKKTAAPEDAPDERDDGDEKRSFVELTPFTGEMDIATALENVRRRVMTVETFACAAREAMDAMPHVADERARRRMERVSVLVYATADSAVEALAFADCAVEMLRQYLGEKRAAKTTVVK